MGEQNLSEHLAAAKWKYLWLLNSRTYTHSVPFIAQQSMTERLHPPRRPVTAAVQVSRLKGTLSRLPRRYKMWIFFGLLHLWQWKIYNNSFKDTTISRSYKYLNFPHGVSVSDEHRKAKASTKGKHGWLSAHGHQRTCHKSRLHLQGSSLTTEDEGTTLFQNIGPH